MDPANKISAGCTTVARELDALDMDPDPGRSDWALRRARVLGMGALLEREVLSVLDSSLMSFPSAGEDHTRATVATLVADVAAVHHAAGETQAAARWFAIAARTAEAGAVRDSFEAAGRDPAGFSLFARARWLRQQGRWDEGDKVLRRARSTLREPALRAAVERDLAGSRPIGSVPALFRLNGFGFGIYGERDRRPDGSYVTTYCVSALFLPVFPIRAYRVVRQSGNRYGFLTREPLSGFARWMQRLVLASSLVGVGGLSASAWLKSPEHRASVAVAHARTAERAHHPEEALTDYESVLREFSVTGDGADMDAAASDFARLLVARVHEPVGADSVDSVRRVILRYTAVVTSSRHVGATRQMTEALARWAGQVGDATPASAEAAMRLYALGDTLVAAGAPSPFAASVRALHVRLGNLLAETWPLDALTHFVAAGDPAGIRAAVPVVAMVQASPSLALVAQRDLRMWSRAATALGDPTLAPLVGQVDAALREAQRRADDHDRADALASDDATRLETVLTTMPGDQAIVSALATLRRSAGDAAGGAALLTALGSPGRLIPVAQRTLAGCWMDMGRLEDAHTILERYVSARLPAFQAAQRDYTSADRACRERLVAQARGGMLPADITQQLTNAPEADRQAMLVRWAQERLAADPTVTAARNALEAQSEVIPAVLLLAMNELRLANSTTGDARTGHLGSAEQLFLAIRDEAEGAPGYRLGLGQVYFRLGRNADGEREFAPLLAGPPEQRLMAASAFRELELTARSREVAEAVFNASTEPVRGQAAMLMSLLAERPEDLELWLRRAPGDPEVQTQLRQVEAERLQREGHLAEADRVYADVAERFTRQGASAPSAANNAALVESARYQCTGDPARLVAGINGLELALRRAPDNAIVTHNLGEMAFLVGSNRVLGRYVDTRVLRIDTNGAKRLLDLLSQSSQGAELLAAVRADGSIRRSMELARQEEVLAPQGTSPYQREFDYATTTDDITALHALTERLSHVDHLDTSSVVAWRTRWESGSDDAALRTRLNQAVASADTVVAAARRSHSSSTLAAALFLRSEQLSNRAAMDHGTEDADAAVAALREAHALWPAAGLQQDLASALLMAATFHAMESAPALAEAHRAEGRRYSLPMVLLHASTGANGGAIRAAIRARPEATEALATLLAARSVMTDLYAWIIATALDDTVLQSATAAGAHGERTRLIETLRGRLTDDPEVPLWLALIAPRG